MLNARYYVRRQECWGGTFVWRVLERDRGSSPTKYRADCVGKVYRTEKGARAMCERANEDWNTFLRGGSITPASGTQSGGTP